jgi:hypothetical protein
MVCSGVDTNLRILISIVQRRARPARLHSSSGHDYVLALANRVDKRVLIVKDSGAGADGDHGRGTDVGDAGCASVRGCAGELY